MESIKRYFRNALIGLATFILSNFHSNYQTNQTIEMMEDDDDYHMFI